MINTSSDIDSLSRRKTSLLDYIPDNVQTPMSSGKMKSRQETSNNSDDFLNLIVRSETKSKLPPKKKTFARYLYSIKLPRSQLSKDYYEKDKYHHQHVQSSDACDMRFFIIRHGERVDRYFGPSWHMSVFDQFGQYRPYHMNFPPDLPTRLNRFFWAFDTPLTRDGLYAAQNVGRVLGLNQFEPTYVYSSPAMRCILTTHQILKGLGLENKLLIRIEPGLLELGAARFGMDIFLKPIDWHNYGINIDLSYQPIITDILSMERADTYYLRSKYVIREIEQRHKNSYSQLLNVLIVAHATSPDTLTWDLIGKQPDVHKLFTQSLGIGYLQMVITERRKQNQFWSLKQVPLESTVVKWV